MGGTDAVPEDDGTRRPRAMIHKKILNVARSHPDASLDAVAAEVSGASAAFVERVLEEYGDPAATSERAERADGRGTDEAATLGADGPQHAPAPSNDGTTETDGTDTDANPDTAPDGPTVDSSTTESTTEPDTPPADATVDDSTGESTAIPDPLELTAKQRETLQAVRERPAATQAELAETLDVTRATISKRVNEIPGFDWKTRRQFVDSVFDTADPDPNTADPTGAVSATTVADFRSRLDALEAQVETDPESDAGSALGPEFTHKVVHACMAADYISEAEELQLLEKLL